MENSVKDIICRRKSVRTFNGEMLRKENKTDGCFIIKEPGFGTDEQMEYIITYEVGH